LNTMFKQTAIEPWMASGGRIGISDSYLGCARQPADERMRVGDTRAVVAYFMNM